MVSLKLEERLEEVISFLTYFPGSYGVVFKASRTIASDLDPRGKPN